MNRPLRINQAPTPNDEPGGDVGGADHMREPIGEGRVEDDRHPIDRDKAPIRDPVSARRLHPAVGGKDPKRREQGAKCDHQSGDEMRPAWHQAATEQKNTEECGLEEEGDDPLIGEQRRKDAGGCRGVPAPVGSELERHHNAGNDAHAKGDRKDLYPEGRYPQQHAPPGDDMRAFERRYEGGESDGECGKQDVPADHPDELQTGQEQRVQSHG